MNKRTQPIVPFLQRGILNAVPELFIIMIHDLKQILSHFVALFPMYIAWIEVKEKAMFALVPILHMDFRRGETTVML